MQNPFQTDWCRRFYARHWGKLWITYAVSLLILGFAIASSLNGTPSDGRASDGQRRSRSTRRRSKNLDLLDAPSDPA